MKMKMLWSGRAEDATEPGRITSQETGDRATVVLAPGIPKFVSIYRAVSHFGERPRYSLAFPWMGMPSSIVTLLQPSRETVNAKSMLDIEVGVSDVDRLVRELARYEARNFTRDRFLQDTGFEIDVALSRYELPKMGVNPGRTGYSLILKALRLPW